MTIAVVKNTPRRNQNKHYSNIQIDDGTPSPSIRVTLEMLAMPLDLRMSRHVCFSSAPCRTPEPQTSSFCPLLYSKSCCPRENAKRKPDGNKNLWLLYSGLHEISELHPDFVKIWYHSLACPTSPTPSSQRHVLAATTTPKRLKHAFQDQRMTLNRGKANAPLHSELVTTGTDVWGTRRTGVKHRAHALTRRRSSKKQASVVAGCLVICR